MKKIVTILVLLAFFTVYLQENAFARARGGGKSSGFGSRGSRTYTPPAKPDKPAPAQNQFQSQQTQQQRQLPPSAAPQQPSRSGGFMKALAGGLLGGFIGSMIFSSLGFGAGHGGFGGFGGIGLIEIILIGLGIFLLFRFLKSRRETAATAPSGGYGQNYSHDYTPDSRQNYSYQPAQETTNTQTVSPYADNLNIGLSNIRQFDPSFDENKFKDTVTDIFFKVQASWMNRDMEPVRHLLASEAWEVMRAESARLKAEGRIDRLENIAMRNVNITEAWQEEGKDYITAEITASVLDYTTDEAGRLIEGSRGEPVRFMEYWTFVRQIGMQNWQLSAMQQEE
ncbi:MAG: Tim44 domain-containing protein [Nitrospirae bacterium]|nr:Tim44 domain-containing protein [Nitrospirota bacterium]MCL5978330.1 Tim44 domain-containing protein [Nitrospirota bacterium]